MNSTTLTGVLIGLLTGTLLALVGFALSRIGKSKDNQTASEIKDLDRAKAEVIETTKRLGQVEMEMVRMKAEAIPINAAYLAMINSGLRHHHAPRLDELLDKMSDGEALTAGELKERDKALEIRAADPSFPEDERIKAKILPDVERLAEIEKINGVDHPKLEVVLVSQPETKDVQAPDGSSQKEDVEGNEE